MLAVVAKLPIKEGKVEEAIEAFKGLMADVAHEEGTLAYTLNQDRSDPNILVVMERYKDQAALDAHSSAPYFKEFFSKSREFIAGKPDISVLEEIHSI
jgi:quinol monooxygenase YgiN